VAPGPWEVPFVEARKDGWLIEDVDGNSFADHCSAWGFVDAIDEVAADPPEEPISLLERGDP
jgi:hypothetical protein